MAEDPAILLLGRNVHIYLPDDLHTNVDGSITPNQKHLDCRMDKLVWSYSGIQFGDEINKLCHRQQHG